MPAERTWTILDLLSEATSFLQGRGIESPRVNAEVLLGHVLDMPRVELYARFDRTVEREPLGAFRELVRRRLARVPLQYLTGRTEFYSRSFAAREGVFIPRPETELLVERALDAVRRAEAGRPPQPDATPADAATPRDSSAPADAAAAPVRFAEIGVGSGAILVTLLLELPGATGVGIDVSPAALALARENAERHGVLARADLREGSLLDPLDDVSDGTLDLFVANPPYLSETIVATLAPEVRDHEPRAALVSGSDGFDAIRTIVAGAWRALRPGGVLALEIGETQGAAVLAVLNEQGAYDAPTLSKDYAGKDRVVIARRRSS